jgi:hypothetical protein
MQPDPYTINVLGRIKNHPSHLEECVDLLYMLQQKRGPLVEVVTVLKYERPLLYDLLKKRLAGNPGLVMLFELSVDYEQAKNNIYGQSFD